jgi:hypothetical protein
MGAIDGIKFPAGSLQRFLYGVFPDPQNMRDLPVRLAGRSELNAFGFPR